MLYNFYYNIDLITNENHKQNLTNSLYHLPYHSCPISITTMSKS